MSKPKEYSWMTKNKLMTYTFVALVILAGVSAISFWPTSIIISVIAVAVAVGLDYLLSKVMKAKGPQNTMSAAVFGLIVALSYSLGLPTQNTVEILPLTAPQAYYLRCSDCGSWHDCVKEGSKLAGQKIRESCSSCKTFGSFSLLKLDSTGQRPSCNQFQWFRITSFN